VGLSHIYQRQSYRNHFSSGAILKLDPTKNLGETRETPRKRRPHQTPCARTGLVQHRFGTEWIGVEEHPTLMRFLGIREAISGIGILTQDHPAESVWSRVAGDGMDLALLGAAMASPSTEKSKTLAAVAAVAGVTALDTYASIRLTQSRRFRSAKSMITVNRPQKEVYEFWRDTNNLKHFIKSVPGDIEIVSARPDEYIEWRSRDGVTVKSASVEFGKALGRDGTEIRLVVDGLIPARLLHEDMRRAKSLLETGEIPTTEGQPAGPRGTALVGRLIHRFEGKEVA
jgi:uncharacterized membrane protein